MDALYSWNLKPKPSKTCLMIVFSEPPNSKDLLFYYIQGDGSTGIWYDTRKVIVKRPYLICRTLTELLINFEVRLAEGSSNNIEPVGYILLWRTSESESWKTYNKFVCKSLFELFLC